MGIFAPTGFSEDDDPASTHWIRHFYTGLCCLRLVPGNLQSISILERGGFISAFAPTHSLARRFGMFSDKACERLESGLWFNRPLMLRARTDERSAQTFDPAARI